MMTAMVGSAEIGPDGEVLFNRLLGDQRFLEPNSGLYWQISGRGTRITPRARCGTARLSVDIDHFDAEPHYYDSDQFDEEPLRVMERTIVLPGSDTQWHFVVAASARGTRRADAPHPLDPGVELRDPRRSGCS